MKKKIGVHGLIFRSQRVMDLLRGLYAYDPVRKRSQLRGPFAVQIQTINRCNASCSMCPYATAQKNHTTRRMDENLYTNILEELKHAGTTHTVALMLQNEPMLDHELPLRIQKAKIILGQNVHVAVVSNGHLLNTKRVNTLLSAGANSIEVSIDAFHEQTYQIIRPGLDFSKVQKNVKELLKLNDNIRVAVRFLRQHDNVNEEKKFKQYWKSLGAQVYLFSIANRAGSLENFEHMKDVPQSVLLKSKRTLWNMMVRTAAKSSSPTPCLLPFSWLNVLSDGRVILCCHDWGPKDIIGDLSKQHLSDVWNGKVMNNHRHMLWGNNVRKSRVCKDCSIAKKN